jgi:hypothetical protein
VAASLEARYIPPPLSDVRNLEVKRHSPPGQSNVSLSPLVQGLKSFVPATTFRILPKQAYCDTNLTAL